MLGKKASLKALLAELEKYQVNYRHITIEH